MTLKRAFSTVSKEKIRFIKRIFPYLLPAVLLLIYSMALATEYFGGHCQSQQSGKSSATAPLTDGTAEPKFEVPRLTLISAQTRNRPLDELMGQMNYWL